MVVIRLTSTVWEVMIDLTQCLRLRLAPPGEFGRGGGRARGSRTLCSLAGGGDGQPMCLCAPVMRPFIAMPPMPFSMLA
jgi:hypothetical protein